MTEAKKPAPKIKAQPPAQTDDTPDLRQAGIFLGVIMFLAVAGAAFFALHRPEPTAPPPPKQAQPHERIRPTLKPPRHRHGQTGISPPAPAVQEAETAPQQPAPGPVTENAAPVPMPPAVLAPQPTAAEMATTPAQPRAGLVTTVGALKPPQPEAIARAGGLAPLQHAPAAAPTALPAQALGYSDIGVRIDATKAGGVIQAVHPNTPAARAGLQAGDDIIAIDNVDVTDMSPAQVTLRLNGADGTAVHLLYYHHGAQLKVTLPRMSWQNPMGDGQ